MRKILKSILFVVVALAFVIGAGVAYMATDWPVRSATTAVSIKVEPTPERLARGKALVGIRCAGCHYDQKTGTLSGIQMVDAPKPFGTIYSHNITKHPTKGLGRYSDGELAFLLRTGVTRDGRFPAPFMQSPHLGDEDLASIIAFLRSDDPWVAATDVEDRQTQPGFLLKVLCHVAWKALAYPKAPIVVPSLEDKVAYGRYVVQGLGDCFACHSADFKTMNIVEPEKSGGYLGGGNTMFDAAGNEVVTPNLTMDPETGLGKWTEDEFVRAVRSGIRKDGRALRYPMPLDRELSEAEVRAVWAYLKTVPVIVNPAAQRTSAGLPIVGSATEGEKLYVKYACVSCHGKDGVGLCDLRGASKKYDTDEKLSAFLHDASKFVPGTKMPTWEGVIAEAEFPSIIAHVHELERRAKK